MMHPGKATKALKQLKQALQDAQRDYDTESGHAMADGALIAFITTITGDPEVQVLYDAVDKWYA